MVKQDKAQGMRWYQFIIWFYLYASAVIGVLVGVGEITGVVYLDMAETFYTLFPMLQVVNVFFGVMQILLAVIALYVRRQLARWKVMAPRYLLMYQIFCLVYYAAYLAGTSLVLGEAAVDWLAGGYILLQVLLLAVNAVYFHRRQKMFNL